MCSPVSCLASRASLPRPKPPPDGFEAVVALTPFGLRDRQSSVGRELAEVADHTNLRQAGAPWARLLEQNMVDAKGQKSNQ
jgi:hypothetical protein